MIEIARSYSRKISLTEYGYPYEMIDLFASRKEEVENKASADDVSDRLAEEAKQDVERQETVLRIKLGEHKKDILRASQEANAMKAKAKKVRKRTTDLQKEMKEHPEKTAGEVAKELPF